MGAAIVPWRYLPGEIVLDLKEIRHSIRLECLIALLDLINDGRVSA